MKQPLTASTGLWQRSEDGQTDGSLEGESHCRRLAQLRRSSSKAAAKTPGEKKASGLMKGGSAWCAVARSDLDSAKACQDDAPVPALVPDRGKL